MLTAWRGPNADAQAALAIMEDPEREFCTSQLVELELLPKAVFFKQKAELEFYRTHFSIARAQEPLSQELGEEAAELAAQYGIAAVDALHLAAAIKQGAEEFITSEKLNKPIFRVREIKVTSIYASHL